MQMVIMLILQFIEDLRMMIHQNIHMNILVEVTGQLVIQQQSLSGFKMR